MLKGTVEVNGVVIGEWTAVRNTPDKRAIAHYDCTIWYRGTDGHIYKAAWQIWGESRANGAISLASRVLHEGNIRARRATNA